MPVRHTAWTDRTIFLRESIVTRSTEHPVAPSSQPAIAGDR